MNGKGGTNRRRSKSRERDNDNRQENVKTSRKGAEPVRYDKKGSIVERPKWTPPVMATEPIPTPNCPYCSKPIKDMAAAVSDKTSGQPVHFDCVIARITEKEKLEKGDSIAYIGGGRFGILHASGSQHRHIFTIKKVLEWENKDHRAEWRKTLSDHYSIT